MKELPLVKAQFPPCLKKDISFVILDCKSFKLIRIEVIDLDKIARLVVEPGKPAYKSIVQQFGNEVLLPNGELDRLGSNAH